MRYTSLATDYDGTLARDGKVDAPTVDALNAARAAGLRLIMVTGRELTDLFNTFPHGSLFDRIVAENGAVVYDPARTTIRTLAPAPPPALLEGLTRRAVPFSTGHSIVATVEPHEHSVLEAIHEAGIEWHVIFNKGEVMALPSEVTKATGLCAVLEELGLRKEQMVGVGDAENDQAFLRVCGFPVAVANALPSIKSMAALVTSGARGAGVIELIGRLLDGGLEAVTSSESRTSD